MKSPKICSRF